MLDDVVVAAVMVDNVMGAGVMLNDVVVAVVLDEVVALESCSKVWSLQ